MFKILSSRKAEKEENSFKLVRIYQVEICGILTIPIVAQKDKSSPVIHISLQNKVKFLDFDHDAWQQIRQAVKERFLQDLAEDK